MKPWKGDSKIIPVLWVLLVLVSIIGGYLSIWFI